MTQKRFTSISLISPKFNLMVRFMFERLATNGERTPAALTSENKTLTQTFGSLFIFCLYMLYYWV